MSSRPSYMPLWDDTWDALLLVEDPTERWQVLDALRKFGRDGTQPEGLNNLQMAVFIAARHGVKFKKKSGAPEGNDNASKNNIETTLKQYSDNVETIGIQSETIGNNPLKNNNSNKNSNREDLKEELDDDENNAHARTREDFPSSSSSLRKIVNSDIPPKEPKEKGEIVPPRQQDYSAVLCSLEQAIDAMYSDEKYLDTLPKLLHNPEYTREMLLSFKDRFYDACIGKGKHLELQSVQEIEDYFKKWVNCKGYEGIPSKCQQESKAITLTPEDQQRAIDAVKSTYPQMHEDYLLKVIAKYCQATSIKPAFVIDDIDKAIGNGIPWNEIHNELCNNQNITTSRP